MTPIEIYALGIATLMFLIGWIWWLPPIDRTVMPEQRYRRAKKKPEEVEPEVWILCEACRESKAEDLVHRVLFYYGKVFMESESQTTYQLLGSSSASICENCLFEELLAVGEALKMYRRKMLCAGFSLIGVSVLCHLFGWMIIGGFHVLMALLGYLSGVLIVVTWYGAELCRSSTIAGLGAEAAGMPKDLTVWSEDKAYSLFGEKIHSLTS